MISTAAKRIIVLCVVLTVVVTGCAVFKVFRPDTYTVQPVVNLKGKHVLIIPFSEQSQGFYTSDYGARLARGIAHDLGSNERDVYLLDASNYHYEFVGKDIESVDMATFAQQYPDVDYVLLGRINELRTKDPGSLNTMRGTLRVTIALYDLIAGGVPVFSQDEEYHYPKEYEGGIPSYLTTDDIDDYEMMNVLLANSSEELAKFFYPHEVSTSQMEERK